MSNSAAMVHSYSDSDGASECAVVCAVTAMENQYLCLCPTLKNSNSCSNSNSDNSIKSGGNSNSNSSGNNDSNINDIDVDIGANSDDNSCSIVSISDESNSVVSIPISATSNYRNTYNVSLIDTVDEVIVEIEQGNSYGNSNSSTVMEHSVVDNTSLTITNKDFDNADESENKGVNYIVVICN